MGEMTERTQGDRLRDLAISGGLGGGIIGLGAGLISPRITKFRELLKPIGLGAGSTAGVAAGSGYIGDEILGDPEPGESNPYTWRTGLGGLAVGTAGGGLAGGALGSGIGKKIADKAIGDTFLGRKLLEYAGKGGPAKAAKLGALGAALGAGASTFIAADEGMQMDMFENERRRRLLEELGYEPR